MFGAEFFSIKIISGSTSTFDRGVTSTGVQKNHHAFVITFKFTFLVFVRAGIFCCLKMTNQIILED